MPNSLLKFSVKRLVVSIALFALILGGGCVLDAPTTEPPISPPPVAIETATVTTPPVVAPPGVAETVTVTVPVQPVVETMTVTVPAEPVMAQPESGSLVAEDFSVDIGARSGGFINPFLNVYDTKALELSATAFDEASIRGVDIDRSTLQIQAVATQTLYGSVQLTESGFLHYQPDSSLTVSAEGLTDTITYSVMTDEDGVSKFADSTITVSLQHEDFERNRAAFDALLADAPAVRNSFFGNFRYSDSEISNVDLAIAEFLIQNDFTDDSIDTILTLKRSVSPLSPVIYDRHTLTKLLSIEQSIYQNTNLNLSPHGPSHWPAEYAEMMKQASFIIPSRIQVVTGLKHIYYDKLDIDNVFVDLGGEYLGMFSMGQNYTPFYVPVDESTQEQEDFFEDRYPGSRGFGFLGYNYDGGRAYFTTLENPLFHWYELVIEFSVVSVLDAFGFTLGDKLKQASPTELTFRHDEFIEINYDSSSSTFGHYGYVLNWERSKLSNGEAVNIYNLVRNIVGLNADSEWEGIFGVVDWVVSNSNKHESGAPFFPNSDYNLPEEVNLLNSLPNNAFFPSAYFFTPRDLGGVYFDNSQGVPGHLTSALRSLGISSEVFRPDLLTSRRGAPWQTHDEATREYNASPSVRYLKNFYNTSIDVANYNVGLVLADGVPWFYEGNFPQAGSNLGRAEAYHFLISQENFTDEKLNEVSPNRSFDSYFRGNTDLKDEYEAVIGS